MADENSAKTVARFLTEIGVTLKTGDDLLGTDPNKTYQEGEQICIYKPLAGVVIWVWSAADFLTFFNKVERLKKTLEKKEG